MRKLSWAWAITAGLWFGTIAPGLAQPAPTAPKVDEPQKVAPQAPSPVVHYTLAGIAVIIVMVLVCMPARRE